MLRAPGVCSVSMGTRSGSHWVLVPASALDHLETQIKTVKENLIRKQENLIKVSAATNIESKTSLLLILINLRL